MRCLMHRLDRSHHRLRVDSDPCGEAFAGSIFWSRRGMSPDPGHDGLSCFCSSFPRKREPKDLASQWHTSMGPRLRGDDGQSKPIENVVDV